MVFRKVVVVFVVSMAFQPLCLYGREWKNVTKTYKMEADYVGFKDGKVDLRKPDGKVMSLDPSTLCEEDQRYIDSQVSEHYLGTWITDSQIPFTIERAKGNNGLAITIKDDVVVRALDIQMHCEGATIVADTANITFQADPSLRSRDIKWRMYESDGKTFVDSEHIQWDKTGHEVTRKSGTFEIQRISKEQYATKVAARTLRKATAEHSDKALKQRVPDVARQGPLCITPIAGLRWDDSILESYDKLVADPDIKNIACFLNVANSFYRDDLPSHDVKDRDTLVEIIGHYVQSRKTGSRQYDDLNGVKKPVGLMRGGMLVLKATIVVSKVQCELVVEFWPEFGLLMQSPRPKQIIAVTSKDGETCAVPLLMTTVKVTNTEYASKEVVEDVFGHLKTKYGSLKRSGEPINMLGRIVTPPAEFSIKSGSYHAHGDLYTVDVMDDEGNKLRFSGSTIAGLGSGIYLEYSQSASYIRALHKPMDDFVKEQQEKEAQRIHDDKVRGRKDRLKEL